MRRTLFSLLLCVTITSCNPLAAQLTIDGLQLGGDAPLVQAPKRRAVVSVGAPASAFPAGWLFYLRNAPVNYVPGSSGQVAAWTDPDTGIAATQSVHLQKPVASGTGLWFSDKLLSVPVRPSIPCTISIRTDLVSNTAGYMWDGDVNTPCYLLHGGTHMELYAGAFVAAEPAIIYGVELFSKRTYSVSMTSDSVYIFRNGVEVTSASRTVSFGSNFTIGNNAAGGTSWSGNIYAISLHPRALTSAECQLIHAAWLGDYP